jgi:hypothetical protein
MKTEDGMAGGRWGRRAPVFSPAGWNMPDQTIGMILFGAHQPGSYRVVVVCDREWNVECAGLDSAAQAVSDAPSRVTYHPELAK